MNKGLGYLCAQFANAVHRRTALAVLLLLASVAQLQGAGLVSAKDDPICTASAPQQVAESKGTILGAKAEPVGAKLDIFKGAPLAVKMQVTGVEIREQLGGKSAAGHFVIVCMKLTPPSSSNLAFPLSHFAIGYGNGADEKGYDRDATTFAATEMLGYKDNSTNKFDRPMVTLKAKKQNKVVVVFDISPGWQNIYLTHTGRQDSASSIKEFVVRLADAPSVGTSVESSSSAASGATGQSNSYEARRLGDTGVVNIVYGRWTVTFETAVEVRDHIGDYSIVPRRGQFLVVWFTQVSSNGKPLPLGSFQLTASAVDGSGMIMTGPAKEGTVALAITEYNWLPSMMDAGIPYRTGVVFDIAPNQTHFRLKYNLGGVQALGTNNPIDIVFDA